MADFKIVLRKEYASTKMEFVADNNLVKDLQIHRYSIIGRPSIQLRKEAYRVLNELRNSLDQVVFVASRLLGGSPKKANIYFPFSQDPTDFETLFLLPKGRCRDTHPDLLPTLRQLTPWFHDPVSKTGDNFLRTLGKLSNPNKHQVIIEFAPHIASYSIGHESSDGLIHVLVLPPSRLDLFNAQYPQYAVPATRNRTDFISAVAPITTAISRGDSNAHVVYCAKEATRIGATPIDGVLNAFVERAAHAVAQIKAFVGQSVNP
ncbi:MAG: hypothetical protein JWL86_3743 [Rhizobium sp.]|nr:hypothetical protein [Rhizobium sp.]